MSTQTAPVANGNGATESFVSCETSQGVEMRATLLKLDRFQATFETYAPAGVLRLSEVFPRFTVLIQGRTVYSGRAVITSLLALNSVLVCEASLEESGFDLNTAAGLRDPASLLDSFNKFLHQVGKDYKIHSDFKITLADMQSLFLDLRLWMDQAELSVRSEPTGDRAKLERELLERIEQPVLQACAPVLRRFEAQANQVEPELQPAHRAYMKRQIHPLVMCSPFLYRTYQKPLGYAGDYEMVNMMLRDPFEGSSTYAKLVNRVFLETPPVLAHQARIDYLVRHLENEARRIISQGQPLRLYNIGCGPAREIQEFLASSELSNRAQPTLLDFSEETLTYTGRILSEMKARHGRATPVQLVKKSVHQLIKESGKSGSGPKYDLVYCAGLFDYLSDQVCKRLMNYLYDQVAPGGLLISTNVSTANPSRNWMEYVLDWHLIYRGTADFWSLAPDAAPKDHCAVVAIGEGVNIGLEVRKPANAT